MIACSWPVLAVKVRAIAGTATLSTELSIETITIAEYSTDVINQRFAPDTEPSPPESMRPGCAPTTAYAGSDHPRRKHPLRANTHLNDLEGRYLAVRQGHRERPCRDIEVQHQRPEPAPRQVRGGHLGREVERSRLSRFRRTSICQRSLSMRQQRSFAGCGAASDGGLDCGC